MNRLFKILSLVCRRRRARRGADGPEQRHLQRGEPAHLPDHPAQPQLADRAHLRALARRLPRRDQRPGRAGVHRRDVRRAAGAVLDRPVRRRDRGRLRLGQRRALQLHELVPRPARQLERRRGLRRDLLGVHRARPVLERHPVARAPTARPTRGIVELAYGVRVGFDDVEHDVRKQPVSDAARRARRPGRRLVERRGGRVERYPRHQHRRVRHAGLAARSTSACSRRARSISLPAARSRGPLRRTSTRSGSRSRPARRASRSPTTSSPPSTLPTTTGWTSRSSTRTATSSSHLAYHDVDGIELRRRRRRPARSASDRRSEPPAGRPEGTVPATCRRFLTPPI